MIWSRLSKMEFGEGRQQAHRDSSVDTRYQILEIWILENRSDGEATRYEVFNIKKIYIKNLLFI